MTQLSVNVNKIAVLRNSRGGAEPDVVRAAQAAWMPARMASPCIRGRTAGTSPPRTCWPCPPDPRAWRRVQHRRQSVRAAARGLPGLLALCEQTRPAQATLVPDGDGQITSDHGFDFERDAGRLRPLVAALKAMGCRVSLFVDAGNPLLERAAEVGADRIELYTGPYAEAHAAGDAAAMLELFATAARRAQAVGLGVNAGHDLSQDNLRDFLAHVPDVLEVSIGHALIGEALYDGLDATVRGYLALL